MENFPLLPNRLPGIHSALFHLAGFHSPSLWPDLPVQNGCSGDGPHLGINVVQPVHGQRLVDGVGHLTICTLIWVVSQNLQNNTWDSVCWLRPTSHPSPDLMLLAQTHGLIQPWSHASGSKPQATPASISCFQLRRTGHSDSALML